MHVLYGDLISDPPVFEALTYVFEALIFNDLGIVPHKVKGYPIEFLIQYRKGGPNYGSTASFEEIDEYCATVALSAYGVLLDWLILRLRSTSWLLESCIVVIYSNKLHRSGCHQWSGHKLLRSDHKLPRSGEGQQISGKKEADEQ
ncbi:hypothetical protein Tco_0348006 [Tanacetum coccineum]